MCAVTQERWLRPFSAKAAYTGQVLHQFPPSRSRFNQ
jgi:hypothetical protein